MGSSVLLSDLKKICPGGVARNISLAQISRWRVGGYADIVLSPSSINQIVSLRKYFYKHNLPHVVVGATSNLLFSDEGLRVPCIQIGNNLSTVQISGESVCAESGAWVPGLSRLVMKAGLKGAEHICGIPGTIGGLICMNGGSQRKGIGDALEKVFSVDISGEEIIRYKDECGFSYRNSIFQKNGEIITTAIFKFKKAENKNNVRRSMLSILSERRKKFPQKQPNCGSVFKSNPDMYASIGPPGAVIESIGLKGKRTGGAIVSPWHANFIVNSGGASSEDILSLICEVKERVFDHTGYILEAEARYVMPDGTIIYADRAFEF